MNTAELMVDLIQHNSKVGLLLFIHCLLLVPLGVGSRIEFLVQCVVLGILSCLAMVLLNTSCNNDMILSVPKQLNI